MRTLEDIIPQLIANVKHEIYARPLFLGGTSASGGGVGGPPGGFIGVLPQTKIAFDYSEEEVDTIPPSGASLLDNLNRIRYRLHQIEISGGGGGCTGDYVPLSGGTMSGNLVMNADIVLSGILQSPEGNGDTGYFTGLAGVLTKDYQIPLFYDAMNKFFLIDKDEYATVDYTPNPVSVSKGGIFSSGGGYAVFQHNNSDVVIHIEFPDSYSHWDAFILQMLPKYYATSFTIEGMQDDGNWYTIADITNWDKPYYAIRVHDLYSGSVNWDEFRITFHSYIDSTYLGVMRLWWASRETNVYFPQYLSIENGGNVLGEVTFKETVIFENSVNMQDHVEIESDLYVSDGISVDNNLEIDGMFYVYNDRVNVSDTFTPSSSSDSDGEIGDICWDDDYIYVKTNNGWKRAPLQTF